ncbi:MAG: ATP-binding protein [Leptolyngbya sp.]|nr:ATP-binding protein [Candidatus Melainabacteria bacterium]
MKTKNCVVLTGGPSVGKTTLLLELRRRGHPVIREVGTIILRSGLHHPSRDILEFQQAIFQRQIMVEGRLKNREECNRCIFLDRGIPDNVAYLTNAGLEVPDDFVSADVGHYLVCFLLEPLSFFERNGIRPDFEGLDFTEKITPLLATAYSKRGVMVINVPAMSGCLETCVAKKADMIEAISDELFRLQNQDVCVSDWPATLEVDCLGHRHIRLRLVS